VTTDVSDIKKGVNGSLWTGVLLIVLGWAFAVPAVSTIVAETWIALILISAEFKLVYAFQTAAQEASSGSCCWDSTSRRA